MGQEGDIELFTLFLIENIDQRNATGLEANVLIIVSDSD